MQEVHARLKNAGAGRFPKRVGTDWQAAAKNRAESSSFAKETSTTPRQEGPTQARQDTNLAAAVIWEFFATR